MSQPTPYVRQFGFTDFAASFPTTPPPGSAVDAEFNAVLATLVGVLVNLARLQRDDGALRNQLVTLDSLNPSVLLALGAGGSWQPRGDWTALTNYAVSDVVQVGTATYVAAIAHTSAASFATAPWVLLFDSFGTVPADGSVTTAKLADAAVTTRTIGFDGLDLTGSVRAATGIQAGTAPLGALLHAKLDAGAVYGKVERKTDAQGAVGYQIIGVGVTWFIGMATDSNDLMIGASTRLSGTRLEQAGTIRAIAGLMPTTGAGAGLTYAGGIGFVTSYDYDGSAWKDLKLRGKDVYLTAAGVDVAKATATGVDFTAASIAGQPAGLLDIPQNVQSGAYTLVPADRGKHIYSANTVGQTVAIPAGTAFPIGSAIVIVNDGTAPITLSPTGGVTLKQAGTTNVGARTLATNGMASLLKVGADRWFVSGPGVS